jgi:GxxExxY protein
MDENDLSYKIIGAAIEVHRHLGPGLLESAYERALGYELTKAGLAVKTQVRIPYKYKEISIESVFRADLMVNDLVFVELKSVERLDPVHFTRTLTYLRMTGLKLALMINFNEKVIKNGIHRIVNHL